MRFKGYKYTFKLNASHSTSEIYSVHNHTFEIALYITPDSKLDEIKVFREIEQSVNDYIADFSGKLLNKVEPFNEINPTLENLAYFFYDKLSDILGQSDNILHRLDITDSPKHVFTVSDEKPNDELQKLINKISTRNYIEKAANILPVKEVQVKQDNEQTDSVQKKVNVGKALLCEEKPFAYKYFFIGIGILCIAAFILTFIIYKTGYYPLGYDIHGHLFKSDMLYNEIKRGNLYPLYSQYWYNGIQPFRYWAPGTYYLMAFLQFIVGGNVMNAYLGFVFCSFLIGGTGWLMFGAKLHRPVLGYVMAFLWFFLPDNARVFFGEGNMPRMFITMFLPILFYCIWQFVYYKKKKFIFSIIVLMFICIMGHLMISAMVGVASFFFLLIYSIANKRWKESVQVILSELSCFAVCGLWVAPALHGGLLAMDSSVNGNLMASLAGKLMHTLNPFIRFNDVTELYIGISIFIIALIGLFLSNRKSSPAFVSFLVVVAGTTTALTPLILKLPLSQFFWIRRFLPIAYAIFVIGLFEWKKLKKAILIIMCVLITVDCVPSMNLYGYDHKMNIPATKKDISQSMDDTLLTEAKSLTNSRLSIMDLSRYGPMPSYATGSLDPKTQYVFGWAWQGASTAQNIVQINEAYEIKNYDYMFDRNKELGADTVIVDKIPIKSVQDRRKLFISAQKCDYKLVDENDKSILFAIKVDGTYGLLSDYKSIAIGSNAAIVPQLLPNYRTGDKLFIDEYTVDELSCYKQVYLSGFFYHDRKVAESIVKSIAQKGVKVFIDMNSIPADPVTNRMSFFDVSAQPISFYKQYPELITENKVYIAKPFDDEYKEWNTVFISGLKHSYGNVWFKDTKLDFIGCNDDENIVFLGLNIMFHAFQAQDKQVKELLGQYINLDERVLPERKIVPLDIKYGKEKITITSDYDDVNTTLAWQDTFVSDKPIRSKMNQLYVDKGVTVITMKYPHLAEGIIVTVVGIVAEVLICLWIFERINKKKKHNEK